MNRLNYWKNKIKEKRKDTDFNDFLKEIVSWYPFSFYKRDGMITSFPQSERMNEKIINSKKFEEERDNLLGKGIKYNFEKNFFEQFQQLYISIPMYNLFQFETENSDYADNIFNSKNAYLSNGVIHDCENIFYSFYIKQNCNNIFNSFMVWDTCENIYFGAGIIKSHNIFYARHIYNSSSIRFSSNIIGCHECILCDGLENQSFCIENEQYSKEEYFRKKEEILSQKDLFIQRYFKLNKQGLGPNAQKSSGRFLPFCENIENGFYSYNVHSGKNIILMGSQEGNQYFYDCFGGGAPSGDNYYGCCFVGTYSDDLYLCNNFDHSNHCFYSNWLTNCSYCIGCIGLKNKSYCILNRQYTKEEWEVLSDKIFSGMEEDGVLGKFFPGKLNPFYFNDTMAGILGNFTKEEVEKEGYMWRDEEIKVDIPEGSEVILTSPHPSPLPRGEGISTISDYQGYDENGNWKINPEILKKVIKDEKGNYYRIVQMEYDFLIKHQLPLPEIHWMERMKLNFGI